MSRPPQAEAQTLGPATTTKEVEEALAELEELLPSLAAAPPARALRAHALLRLLRQNLVASPTVYSVCCTVLGQLSLLLRQVRTAYRKVALRLHLDKFSDAARFSRELLPGACLVDDAPAIKV